jgi:hypothetical protein
MVSQRPMRLPSERWQRPLRVTSCPSRIEWALRHQTCPRLPTPAYHARVPLHQGSVIDPSDCVERERRPEGSACRRLDIRELWCSPAVGRRWQQRPALRPPTRCMAPCFMLEAPKGAEKERGSRRSASQTLKSPRVGAGRLLFCYLVAALLAPALPFLMPSGSTSREAAVARPRCHPRDKPEDDRRRAPHTPVIPGEWRRKPERDRGSTRGVPEAHCLLKVRPTMPSTTLTRQ